MSEKTRKQDRRTRYTRQTIKETFFRIIKAEKISQKSRSLKSVKFLK